MVKEEWEEIARKVQDILSNFQSLQEGMWTQNQGGETKKSLMKHMEQPLLLTFCDLESGAFYLMKF